jgi:hypothetical protein
MEHSLPSCCHIPLSERAWRGKYQTPTPTPTPPHQVMVTLQPCGYCNGKVLSWKDESMIRPLPLYSVRRTDRTHRNRYHHSQAESGTQVLVLDFAILRDKGVIFPVPPSSHTSSSTSCLSTNQISAPTTLRSFTVAKEIVLVARADTRSREIEKGKNPSNYAFRIGGIQAAR